MIVNSIRIVVVVGAVLFGLKHAAAQSDSPPDKPAQAFLQWAPTPPMGWNSWDSYGESINETQVRANAEWMAKHLKQFGWQYVVIDEGWYLENPGAKPADLKFVFDENGRFIPAVSRFPSSAGGTGFTAAYQSFNSADAWLIYLV
jgi:hypothetical protein